MFFKLSEACKVIWKMPEDLDGSSICFQVFLQLRNTKMSPVSFKLSSKSWKYYKRFPNGFYRLF